MAKDRDNSRNIRNMNKTMDDIDARTQDLFKRTYYSKNTNQTMLNKIGTDLDDIVNTAIRGNPNNEDLSNTTRLYTRIAKKSGDGQSVNPLVDKKHPEMLASMLDNDQMMGELMNSYADTRWVKQMDAEYDMITHYMPKLKDALDILRDNVLCADSFSKEFINIMKKGDTDINDEKFVANIDAIKEKYNLEERFEEMYDDASLYGEYFLYLVPFKKAFKELLARKHDTNFVSFKEASILENGRAGTLIESNKFRTAVNASKDQYGNMSINVKLHKNCILEEVVENYAHINKIAEKSKKMLTGMYESFLEESKNETSAAGAIRTTITKYELDKTIGDELSYEDDTTSSDGFITSEREKTESKINAPGCIMKKVDRGDIIPIYIEDMCLGYINIGLSTAKLTDDNAVINNGFNTIGEMYGKSISPTDTGETMIRYIANQMSRFIDSNFINSNQDLSNEIYMILKYNDRYNRTMNGANVDVTFIPPEDIIHFKFKTDPKTHRGISDLYNALIPAKLWIMLSTTLTLGTIIRGQDRRVYYVKQSVESNVARSLLNVISQIKKGNFGIRQMESINNILGILGKFNDMVIPVGPSGDPPINFEIMPGQQIDVPTDLMSTLEESAVNSTNVPLEIVQSSNGTDFAIRYTMTNSKFLRYVIKRQAKCMRFYSEIATKVYNCEFKENKRLVVLLPMPAYLAMTNGAQLYQNAKQYVDGIVEVEMADATDDEKIMFTRKLMRYYLPTYINVSDNQESYNCIIVW